MKLTRIAGDCGDNIECPAVYVSDRGTIVVQGYTLARTGLDIALADDESAVEIPLELLKEAARAHAL